MKIKVDNCVLCIYSETECFDYDVISKFRVYKKIFEIEVKRTIIPIGKYPVLDDNYNFSNGLSSNGSNINVNLEKFTAVLKDKKLTAVLKNMIYSGIYKIIITN